MLSENEFVRVFHHQVKEKFGLYDFVIVGIVNDTDPDGIFNVQTLRNVDNLTAQLLSLRRTDDGLPQVVVDNRERDWRTVDLAPKSAFKRAMNVVFMHDPNRLFDEEGDSAIIARELISPSVVDNIKQADMGSLKLEYLMEHVPTTREEAQVIRYDAMNNPLYKGTLVSEDEKAVCIYIPIIEKPYSYNVAALVRELTGDWEGHDKIYIAGLPVAEDTFGVEMLVQMAISAPLAMLILFLLMYVFFKRVSLIMAPLLLAVITVIWTMGLLIGLGFDVHIMSSMIPIFIMPITVCNSIHVLSEFFDSYRRFQNKVDTFRHVIQELFMPMVYATTTTIVGFASLATTPIPPVRVFGLHVAFGVAVGWLLTMTFVPAFINLFISEKSLAKVCAAEDDPQECETGVGLMGRILYRLGLLTYKRSSTIIVVTTLILGLSIIGILRINVNDNPVKWFTKNHELRVADRVLNDHFGGTYTAYLTLAGDAGDLVSVGAILDRLRKDVPAHFGDKMPAQTKVFLAGVDRIEADLGNKENGDPAACFSTLAELAETVDKHAGASWKNLADEINYMDPVGLTYAGLVEALKGLSTAREEDKRLLFERLGASASLTGEALMDRALDLCDELMPLSFARFLENLKTELNAPAFKRPDVLHYVAGLQDHLMSIGKVGKTSSPVDALEKAAYELKFVAPPSDAAGADRAAIMARNEANFAIPESAAEAGQIYIQLEGMKKKDTLFHLVTRDFMGANIWVQLTSGDNQDMKMVVDDVNGYVETHKPPLPLEFSWAGLTYLNIVWQEKMVTGMLTSLASSFIGVLLMMFILFRSGLFGLLAMIPLTVTITFIYGLIGWVGKDYDMPVAILSAMTLGLSIDFAIHFLERSREMFKGVGNWKETNPRMFAEPAKAISRNAIVIALGFLPLLLAPLVPYRTVGFFLAMIMLMSWLATLFILPAIIRLLEKRLFKKELAAGQARNQ
ncbi:RND family transporter [Thermodesulfobacteriota bacterium]